MTAAQQLDPHRETLLLSGTVIPAHPLALTPDGQLDEARQRGLTRYYLSAGVGGLAVGVHTTQFAIRDPDVRLYERLLRLAMEEITAARAPVLRIAGACGPIAAARVEVETAANLGYDLALLSMSAWSGDDARLLADVAALSEILPIVGFYLQPAVGGRYFSYEFWRRFVEIPGVRAIKVAAFDRYRSLDVLRAIAESGREDLVAYTGNDDNIVLDLLTPHVFATFGGDREVRYVGGLLGQWAVWTDVAVVLHRTVRSYREHKEIPAALLRVAAAYTDANAAIFDAANGFRGCIPGINEVLRRNGLLATARCLDANETLSPGQVEELDRVTMAYPFLHDPRALVDVLPAATRHVAAR